MPSGNQPNITEEQPIIARCPQDRKNQIFSFESSVGQISI